jgi:hypothetical protein
MNFLPEFIFFCGVTEWAGDCYKNCRSKAKKKFFIDIGSFLCYTDRACQAQLGALL